MILTYILILIPMVITYGVGIGLNYLGTYEVWYATSPIMHSIGGFVTAWTIWSYTKMVIHKRKRSRYSSIAIGAYLVGGVLMVGLLWEWHEYILDVLFHTDHILGVGDTLLDLTMDAVGAVVFVWVDSRYRS